MSMGKKSNNGPKKKGMALNDDAVGAVTGGTKVHVTYEDSAGPHEETVSLVEWIVNWDETTYKGARIIDYRFVESPGHGPSA